MKTESTCTDCSKAGKNTAMFGMLALLLVLLFVMNLCIGSVRIPIRELANVLFKGQADETFSTVVSDIRMPRAVAAALLGGALALSGYLLQTFFQNPLAGPFVLGISSGAKLFVALTMIIFLRNLHAVTSAQLIISAFAGSMLCMGAVTAISRHVRNMSVLVLAGVMTGYICSAITDIVVTFADDADIVNLHNWSLGSFSGISWDNVKVITAVVSAAFILTFLLSKPMAAYQLGEEYALNMGVNMQYFRAALVVLSSVLSACVTAFAGPVSFVGIAVPQLIKKLFHTSRPLLMIPGSFLGGAVFCLFCDLLARTVFAPAELSISTVTAIWGAPVVMAVMLRRHSGRFVS